ncbi:MAG: hypothetical protein HY678_11415 [Chloroflexi bacterium]|nr:hypothetical protein [Chloroflexota bacterium]
MTAIAPLPRPLSEVMTATDSLSADSTGVLQIEQMSAAALIDTFGSPLYVVSEATLRANYRRAYRAFSSRWQKPVNVLYAIKANNNLAIRAVLHQEGAGGDCFGEGELYATFASGADPEKIVMNGTNKSLTELRQAVELGVRINIDSEDEILTLGDIAADIGRKARVSLRLKVLPPELERFTGNYPQPDHPVAGGVASMQWGFSVQAAHRLVPQIRETPGIVLEGYHMHVGRSTADPDFHRATSLGLLRAVVELHRATGFAPAILNIGGGYARERDPESGRLGLNSHTIESYAGAITATLRTGLQEAGLPLPELWLEPGRYIVGNAVVLLGTVGAIKRDLGKTWVNTDISVNNLMRIETAGSCYTILAASRLNDPHEEPVDIVGPLCLGGPLGEARSMPRLARGDLLAVLDAGMYAETASTQINGVPRPATVLVDHASAELIKERETVLDVFGRHRIPPRLRAGGTAT